MTIVLEFVPHYVGLTKTFYSVNQPLTFNHTFRNTENEFIFRLNFRLTLNLEDTESKAPWHITKQEQSNRKHDRSFD